MLYELLSLNKYNYYNFISKLNKSFNYIINYGKKSAIESILFESVFQENHVSNDFF